MMHNKPEKTAENSHLEQAKTSMWSKQFADVGFWGV